MTRAVLAVMAGLLCALAGMKHAAALQGDARRLSRWVELLRHLALLLKEGTLSIPEALCTAADGQHPADSLLRDIAARMRASPLTTAEDAFAAMQVPWEERETLLRCFRRLGHGSRDSRCLAVTQAADELALRASAASARADKDARLWQTLGLTGGICLTIMLL